jgi:hypothetical protein
MEAQKRPKLWLCVWLYLCRESVKCLLLVAFSVDSNTISNTIASLETFLDFHVMVFWERRKRQR